MAQTTSLISLFKAQPKGTVLELQNHLHVPVGALYLDSEVCDLDHLIISELYNEQDTGEKYYLFSNGLAVFFTYYRKSEDYNI